MRPTGREKVTRTAEAHVVEVTPEAERVVLRATETRKLIRATAPPGIAELADPGERATIYLDDQERVLGWYLPDERVGVREEEN